MLIVNSFDKGISIGKRSSVILTNSTLVNCNIGVGVKDSSRVSINQCVFYGNGSAVSCYEKIPGRAGGNARIYNSILSNAYTASYQSDDKSTIQFTNSLSDNDTLPAKFSNITGNPLFADPTHFGFSLLSNSPALMTGLNNGLAVNIGTMTPIIDLEPEVIISKIYLNPLKSTNAEFLALYNPSINNMNLSGYSINKGVNCIIPEGTTLNPGETLYITSDVTGWSPELKVIQWIEGKLNNQGESIQLLNQYGMVADYVSYAPNGAWPMAAFNSEAYLNLINPNSDNHFPENWEAKLLISGISKPQLGNSITVYPNPSTDFVTIKGDFSIGTTISIYNSLGQMILQTAARQNNQTTLSVSDLREGMYILKIENISEKIYIQR